ncbi:MAG: hypothetical protein EHM58_17545 [Ignavibacteriae bacterium]|nr:MAG: hypothetical protein EHM58_17545 [Ignavibacteriota bacterium]
MYYKIEDFLKDWEYESGATLKILSALDDDSLRTQVYENGRTLSYLAWHITISLGEMMSKTGLRIDGPAEDSMPPEIAKEIKITYEKAANSLMEQIKEWSDDTLLNEDEMYGEKWKRGTTLGVLITHQIHHRGQMTVLMRQAGLKVPGIYGPSYEEWAAYGMQPMK